MASDKSHLNPIFRAKLEESCLTLPDAKKLEIKLYTADEALRQFPWVKHRRGGMRIPYFLPDGKLNCFSRFRFLEEPTGFSALIQKPPKYVQEKDTLNEVYLPRFVAWTEILNDPATPLYITEGELKAACATKLGLPTMGLGGVWCFLSTKKGIPFLPALEGTQWPGRKVYILFDSDARKNPDVNEAANRLAQLLLQRGADPYVRYLPDVVANGKTGLDDYLRVLGLDALKAEVIEKAKPWRTEQSLFQLNAEVVYATNPGIVMRLKDNFRMRPNDFVQHQYAPRTCTVIEHRGRGADRKEVAVEKPAAAEWLKWPGRAEVQAITYAPGQSRITEAGCLNVWPGWAVGPRKGDIKPWKQLLEYMFGGAEDERKYLEQWLAYPLQHPGAKLFTAVLLWSRDNSTGKGSVGYTMKRIYGSNWTEIQDNELFGTFNEWAENKQFVLGDEITGGGRDKKDNADRLKSLITRAEIRLNRKFVPTYTLPDCINYLFTSNHPDAFYVDDEERRLFVHEVRFPLGREERERWFRETYYPWLNDGGAAALFHHLLQLDLTGFEPQAHAPDTIAKDEMREATMGELRAWVTKLRDNPLSIFCDEDGSPNQTLMSRQVWTAKELLAEFKYQHQATREDQSNMGRALRNAGCRKIPVPSGKGRVQGVRTEDGKASIQCWWVRPGPPPAHLLTAKGVKEQYEKERPMLEVKAAQKRKEKADEELRKARERHTELLKARQPATNGEGK